MHKVEPVLVQVEPVLANVKPTIEKTVSVYIAEQLKILGLNLLKGDPN